MPLILVLEMLKRGDHHFEASLGYIEGSKLSKLHGKTLRGSLMSAPLKVRLETLLEVMSFDPQAPGFSVLFQQLMAGLNVKATCHDSEIILTAL